jgi:hypothetical protein
MAKTDDVRAALERELEGYERMGNTERASEVKKAIAALGGRRRIAVVDKTVEGPPENAAERTGGVTTDDLGALGNEPVRPRTRGKK